MKKILFINPLLQPGMKRKARPIGLTYIMTAVMNADIDFNFIDMYATDMTMDDLKDQIQGEAYDICALGCVVTGFRQVREIVSVIRDDNPEAMIIAGNTLASSIPELLLRNTEVDIAVIGEGDVTIVQLLRALINNQPFEDIKGIAYLKDNIFHQNQMQDLIIDMDKIIFPEWYFLDNECYNEGYLHVPVSDSGFSRVYPINIARGCPYHCTFCYHVFMGQSYRRCSDDIILNEFMRLYYKYDAMLIIFCDELSFLNIPSLERMLTKIESLPFQIYWSAITRSDLFCKKDIPLIRRMRDAGCINICFSFENASQEILDAMNKKLQIEKAEEHISAIIEGGIKPLSSIVFGYPQETPGSIKETYALCERYNIVPHTGFLQPLPATPIYDWAIQQGYIKDEFEYIMQAGDREVLHVNLTKIPTNEFIDMVVSGITDLAKKLRQEDYCQFLIMLKEYNWLNNFTDSSG